jgi:hypothetical protein
MDKLLGIGFDGLILWRLTISSVTKNTNKRAYLNTGQNLNTTRLTL